MKYWQIDLLLTNSLQWHFDLQITFYCHYYNIIRNQFECIVFHFDFLFYFCCRIKEQPRFPEYTRNHVILFSHACYWDTKATQSALERYASIRASAADIFDNRDPLSANCQQIFNAA